MANDVLSRKFHIERDYIASPQKAGNILLFQVGRSHSAKDYMIGEHVHRHWFELTYILEGKGIIMTNGIATPIKAGEIYLSFPGDIHAIHTDNEHPIKFHFLSFWPDDEKLLPLLEKIMHIYSDPGRRIFTDKDVEYLIGSVLSEALLNDEHSADMLSYALNQIIRYIVRSFIGKKKNTKVHISSSEELCYQIMNFIHTHIYAMDGLTDLSKHFGYSYSYLSDVFHKTTGDTLINYYTLRRLGVAAMLVKENNLSVSKIAELLKYSSIYSFSRAFKNHFGKSPTEYKKQVSVPTHLPPPPSS